MDVYLPYIVSIICALISGYTSYAVARKQTKADITRIEKQHELDIDKERELFAMEKEKMELDFRYKLELQKKESESKLGESVTNTLISEAMKMPEVRHQFSQGIKNGSKKRNK